MSGLPMPVGGFPAARDLPDNLIGDLPLTHESVWSAIPVPPPDRFSGWLAEPGVLVTE